MDETRGHLEKLQNQHKITDYVSTKKLTAIIDGKYTTPIFAIFLTNIIFVQMVIILNSICIMY